MADETNTTATAPAVDTSIKNWTVAGKPLTVRTFTRKSGDKKGQPTLRILTSGDVTKKPTFAQLITVVSNLGTSIADALAPIIDKEILQDIASEAADRIVAKDDKGVFSLNEAKFGDAIAAVIAAYLEQKAGKDVLRAKLASIQEEQTKLMGELMAAIGAQKDIRSPEFKALTNRAGAIALEISELKSKLEKSTKKAATAK